MNQQEEKREASLLNLFIRRDALSLLTFNKRLMRENETGWFDVSPDTVENAGHGWCG